MNHSSGSVAAGDQVYVANNKTNDLSLIDMGALKIERESLQFPSVSKIKRS